MVYVLTETTLLEASVVVTGPGTAAPPLVMVA
jgi:hypothetical protein